MAVYNVSPNGTFTAVNLRSSVAENASVNRILKGLDGMLYAIVSYFNPSELVGYVIGRISNMGQWTVYQILTTQIVDAVVASDGALWVLGPGAVFRVEASGSMSTFQFQLDAYLDCMCCGPEGTVYVGNLLETTPSVYCVTPTGQFRVISSLPFALSSIILSSDGMIWGVGSISISDAFVRISPNGSTTVIRTPRQAFYYAITINASGELWACGSWQSIGLMTRIEPTGELHHYKVPSTNVVYSISGSSDGSVWGCCNNQIIRVAPNGVQTSWNIPYGNTICEGTDEIMHVGTFL